jgi:hypothetical protein
MPALTTAYAGHGKTTEENVAAVLDNLLPDELGMVYVPEKVTRLQPGLRATVKWLEGEVGEDGTIPVPDLIEALVTRRNEGDDVTLVMVYDAENDHDVDLAKKAVEWGIRVIDLAAAGDDIVFEAEAAEPEPPADEQPPFEGGTPIAPSPAEQIAAATQAGLDAAAQAAAQRAAEQMALPVSDGSVTLTFNVTLSPASVDAIAAAIVARMGMQAQSVVTADAPAGSAEALAPVVPIGTVHDGSDDVAGQPEGTVPYYYDEDKGSYRRPRGRKRDGETRVFLTPDQVKEAQAKNMLA